VGWQLSELQNVCSNFVIMEASFEALCPAYRLFLLVEVPPTIQINKQ